MRRLTRREMAVRRMLRNARTVAVVGASARPGAPSNALVSYLRGAGFDVLLVHPERAAVAGRAAYPALAALPSSVDLVVVFEAPDGVVSLIDQAAAKRAAAVWVMAGEVAPDVARHAAAARILLVAGRDLARDHRAAEQAPGNPRSLGGRGEGRAGAARGRGRHQARGGWVEAGGGGRSGGGGSRAVLDEKKMPAAGPAPGAGSGPRRRRR